MLSHRIIPVILAGGSGTRLWPVSRAEMPKQFCNLTGSISLFQQTLRRVADPAIFAAPIILTNDQHASVVRQQLDGLNVEPQLIIQEPVGRDTAAAIFLACEAKKEGAESVMLVLPSDHHIADEKAFLASVVAAKRVADFSNSIITFGIKPTRPETGFGYIRAGRQLAELDICELETFIEKPSLEKAEQLIGQSDVFWNAGMFMFRKDAVISEAQKYASDMLALVRKSLGNGTRNGAIVHPEKSAFAAIRGISFDYAIMEHTELAKVQPMNAGWSDLGTWQSILEHGAVDANSNVIQGAVYSQNTTNSLMMSDGPLVSVNGLKDVVVVATKDAVLVSSATDSQSLKAAVEQMKLDSRPEVQRHTGENRPWGRFDSLDRGATHQVKRIKVVPGGRLSLQYHHHRAEHWIVISGTATVTVGESVRELAPCDQVFIPQGAVHRLENFTDQDVEIIEVQYGTYFGEDDIVRVEDVYGRNPTESSFIPAKAA